MSVNTGTAYIDPMSGKAVIEAGEKRYSLEPDKDVRLDPGVHTGMFLQPAMAARYGVGIETRSVDEAFPFPQLCEYVENQYRIHHSLRCIIDSIDPDYHSGGSRFIFAEAAEKLLQDDGIYDAVREQVLGVPPVQELRWDTRYPGRVGEILEEVRTKYHLAA